MLKVAIASDHAGFDLKECLESFLKSLGYEVLDLGTNSKESVDYPDFGYKLADIVASGSADFGIAICGSGIGISIAANRNPKIRAALCHDINTATLARQHNDANVLALGSRIVSQDLATSMVQVFLSTKFEAGRHEARVHKLKLIPKQEGVFP